MSPFRRALTLALIIATCVASGVTAVAQAAPSNDGRDSAQQLTGFPASVTGTTHSAKIGDGESVSPCADDTNSVWYRVDTKHRRRLVVRLRAGGDLEATLTVYHRLRSQQRFLTCDITDTHGRGTVAFTARHAESYLIRVAQRTDSAPGDFRLSLQSVGGARLPGPALPFGGVAGSLDRVGHTAQPWSVRLRPGVRYRMALEQPGNACLTASLYGPSALKDGLPAITHLTCDHDYALITPHPHDRGGRFTIMVNASTDVRGPQRYHLQVAPAAPDDSAPGIALANIRQVRGTLDGAGVDIVDLYRFSVIHRSKLLLRLRAHSASAFDLELLDGRGDRVRCVCDSEGDESLVKGLHLGTYYVAVRARSGSSGTYRLLRALGTITNDHLTLSRSPLAPGVAQQMTVRVVPAVSGPVVISVEQFDPLAGWQFVRTVHAVASDGKALISYVAPSVGRWRASARYEGTGFSAASHTGYLDWLVTDPRVSALGGS